MVRILYLYSMLGANTSLTSLTSMTRSEGGILGLSIYGKLTSKGARMGALYYGCNSVAAYRTWNYLYSARMPGTRSGVRRP